MSDNFSFHPPTETLFNEGDTVVITEGPFAGLEAAYQMPDTQQRAMVLLHLLSQPVPVKIDFTEIKVSRAQIGGRTASKVACRPASRVSNSKLWHRAVAAIKASGNFARRILRIVIAASSTSPVIARYRN